MSVSSDLSLISDIATRLSFLSGLSSSEENQVELDLLLKLITLVSKVEVRLVSLILNSPELEMNDESYGLLEMETDIHITTNIGRSFHVSLLGDV
jgi:hypothetical protein